MSYSLVSRSLVIAAGLLLVAEAAEAGDAGRWRLPSTTAQYFGYGYGPGHQAPMIRSPKYQPPQVPRIVVIPARDCPFCHAGCSRSAGAPQAGAWNCNALIMPGATPRRSGGFPSRCQPRPAAPTPARAMTHSAMVPRRPLFAAPQTANAAEPPPVASQEQAPAEVKGGSEAG